MGALHQLASRIGHRGDKVAAVHSQNHLMQIHLLQLAVGPALLDLQPAVARIGRAKGDVDLAGDASARLTRGL